MQKQNDIILIDGYNVAECEFISESNKCDVLEIFECEDYPNCYFKQLQRMKAENEELKEKVKLLDSMTGIFSARQAKKYHQALEKIKRIVNKFCSDCICLNKNCKGCVADDTKRKINEVLRNEEQRK